MFSTIFKQELKYWFQKPIFYIYISIFFLISLLLSATAAGIWDGITGTTGSSRIVNSPIGVTGLLNGLTILIFFLFPSIIGVSIYRDFKSEMHTILYSYPFTKANYLFAKFFSGIVVVSAIVLVIAFGMSIGFRFPGTNSDIVGDFNIMTYLQTYLVYILPNVLFFGAVVFAIVTFSRNIAAGFITVIILFFAQGALSSIFSDPEQASLLAILDPFGSAAADYYTKYWTIFEQNELQIPIKELIIYNRLLWLAISSLIFGLVYKFFKFNQNAISISFRKVKSERVTKNNFSGITRITLPKVTHDYSFSQNLKTMWRLSNLDFKYIFTSLPFICILVVGILLLVGTLFTVGEIFGTKTLPVTWQMLGGGNIFSALIINLCTFLYAGILVQRANTAKISHLVDSTPIPNWTLLFSKLIALLKMQLVLLAVIMVSGMLFQAYQGYYDFEIGHYLKELYGLKFLNYVIWALLAIFIQTLVKNQYLGFFILLILAIGIPFLSLIGIELSIFKYNEGPGYSYSDMNGYGSALSRYLWYKLYWILGGTLLLIVSMLMWVRGLPNSFAERFYVAKQRFKTPIKISFMVVLVAFLTLGVTIYQKTKSDNKNSSSKQAELDAVKWEKTYKKYENYKQPRITAVNAEMHIYPKKKTYKASAIYTMINKTNQAIDSVFLNHNSLESTFEFNKPNNLVLEDTVFNFDIYKFDKKIQPGDTLQLTIHVKSNENSMFQLKSPILENGTFISNSSLFPSLGYNSRGELTDDKTREKYKLPKNNLRPAPTDSTALGNTYISKDSDWIDFEATVSTSKDQIAIAPGYLQKEWTEGDRKFFHYKMDSKMLNFYAFNSARYEVKKEMWKGISLEIYYHKLHDYNLDRMMKGMKASLTYNAKNFSPYQHKQLRIIEFPRIKGTFAQSFANTIPFSEGFGFIADVDEKDENGVDYPFAVTVHEVSHQWWAHQVIGADVLGATMLSESLSEYVSLKVLEHQHGKPKMRTFLKEALDSYLMQRTFEAKREKPLMYNDGQGYIHYQKGSLVFYALSDYIGEENLNGALKKYVEKVKFQDSPYTTSTEMVNYIRKVTPDSLQYVIKDMFETITLYKNRIVGAKTTELENGKYQVDIEFEVSKYRNDEKGKKFYGEKVGDTLSYKSEKMSKSILSVPLQDYIDIGVFTEEEVDGKKKEKELYLQKHKITQINNKITIIVDKKPREVGVDPYNKLIDTQSNDNRRKL
ncbi:ABC-2 type transport system permease protein [Polaribacter sp. KT25b]|uniref:ABC transporter permease/M1 family aminopeptidase n=1 Tax=Polaribacter sp. KT25b TaxID=1855336 RepID=UPI00087C5BE9|nr:M1 family aminopeptidase [Polaribacter sp. KT25b]SDS15454.1 ABC-2 type transport system permease protein [Polaribacter sp. KT25b]